MGGQLGETQSQTSQSIKSYFKTLFPYFLSIGMTYEQFWEEDTDLINDFIKAEQYRQTKLNNQLWLQGIYERLAIGSCLSKGVKYPKEPIPLSQDDVESAKQQRVEKLRKALLAKAKK